LSYHVFHQVAAAEIDAGVLDSILERLLPPDELFYLYYAKRAHMPSRLRAFIEFMKQP
jgi:DNA-binding transcriptional LysR family regulator